MVCGPNAAPVVVTDSDAATFRAHLLTLATGHPSREVRKLIRSFDVAIASYLGMLSYVMVFEQVPDEPEAAEAKELAQQSYEEAQQLLAKFLEIL